MKISKRLSKQLTAIMLAGVLTVTAASIPVLASDSIGTNLSISGTEETVIPEAPSYGPVISADTSETVNTDHLGLSATDYFVNESSRELQEVTESPESSKGADLSDEAQEQASSENADFSGQAQNPDAGDSTNLSGQIQEQEFPEDAGNTDYTENTETAGDHDTENTETAEDNNTENTETAGDHDTENTETADDNNTEDAETAGDHNIENTATADDNDIENTETAGDHDTENTETAEDNNTEDTETANDIENTESANNIENTESTETSEEGAASDAPANTENTEEGTASDTSANTENAGDTGDTAAPAVSEGSENSASSEDESLVSTPGDEESTSEDSTDGSLSQGNLGLDVTWTLDDEGTFTVSGTGDMYDFPEPGTNPILEALFAALFGSETERLTLFGNIKKVVINEGVTSIGDGIFKSCASLTSVSLPNGLISVGKNSFSGCSSLKKIVLPSTLLTIEESAFANTGLTTITIPKNVDTIGSNAFSGCSELNKLGFGINAPSSIESDSFSSVTATATYNNFLNEWTSEKFLDYGGKITWSEEAISLDDCNCGIPKKYFTYTGSEIKPSFTITYDGKALNLNTHYTAKYSSNINAGSALLTLTGKGSFTGTQQISFTIGKAEQIIKITASANPISVGESATVSLTGVQGTATCVSLTPSVVSLVQTDNKTCSITAKKVGLAIIQVLSTGTDNYNAPKLPGLLLTTVVPGRTSALTVSDQNKGFKVTWQKVDGADGYLLYRGDTQIAELLEKDFPIGSSITYTDKTANTNGTKYTYKVKATGSTGISRLSRSVSTYKVIAPSIQSAVNTSYRQMKVQWNKNSKASGYQLQYAKNSSFTTGRKTVTISKNSTVSQTFSSLTKGKTYYLRIRAYKTVGSKKYYSLWSSKKTVKISSTSMPLLATDVTKASSGKALIRIKGVYYTLTSERILKKINNIRYEACKEGVTNPVNGKKLTLSDYVPLKWSTDLERIAQIRAAESVFFYDQYGKISHTRPNGKSCHTCTYNGTYSWDEVLSQNYDKKMHAIEQAITNWYMEKSLWVKKAQKGHGHYTALIKPTFNYVGVGCFKPFEDDYYYVTAQFSFETNLSTNRIGIAGAYEQFIEISASRKSTASYYNKIKIPLSAATVTGIKNKKYTGKSITQSPTLKIGTTVLVKGTDYTLSYKNNKKVGKATVTIKGKGYYTGTIKKTFKITK